MKANTRQALKSNSANPTASKTMPANSPATTPATPANETAQQTATPSTTNGNADVPTATATTEVTDTRTEVIIRPLDYRTKNKALETKKLVNIHWRDAAQYIYQRDFYTYVEPDPRMLNPYLKVVGYLYPRTEVKENATTGAEEKIDRVFLVEFDADYVFYFFYKLMKAFSPAEVDTILDSFESQDAQAAEFKLRTKAIEMVKEDNFVEGSPEFNQAVEEVLITLKRVRAAKR